MRNREKKDPAEGNYDLAEEKKDLAEGNYDLAEEKKDLAERKYDLAERKREPFYSWGEHLSAEIQLHFTPLNPIGDLSGAKVQITEKHLLEKSATAHSGRLDQTRIDSAEGE